MKSVSPKPNLRPGAFSNITNFDYATPLTNRKSSVLNTNRKTKKSKREDILARIQRLGKENIDENELIVLPEPVKVEKVEKKPISRNKSARRRAIHDKHREEVEQLENEIMTLKRRVNKEKVYVRNLKTKLKDSEINRIDYEKKHTQILQKFEIEMANLKNNNLQLSLKHNKYSQL